MIDRFLLLGLRLGRHIDGFVDAYYGPEEHRKEVDAEPPADPRELADEAARLLELAAGLEGARGRWLRAQLGGLEATARRLAGDELPWVEEVQLCYGVTPVLTAESAFEEAHALLDDTFGDEEGYRRWLDSQTVPPEKVLEAADVLRVEARERTRELFGLPDGEDADVEIVTNEPWEGFNYYQGGLRSRVVVNVDLPTWSHSVPGLVAHELYPGHHTERAWKERLLVGEQGLLEESIMLTGTPQSLVSEGIAMVSAEALFGDDLHPRAAELLRPLGIPYDVEGARAFDRVGLTLRRAGDNMAWFLNVEGRPVEEVVEYGMHWRRSTRERALKGIEFLTDPTWRAYSACYSHGYTLVRGWVDGDRGRFRRLLTEQLTPADLAA